MNQAKILVAVAFLVVALRHFSGSGKFYLPNHYHLAATEKKLKISVTANKSMIYKHQYENRHYLQNFSLDVEIFKWPVII